jgi:hypothetical protein
MFMQMKSFSRGFRVFATTCAIVALTHFARTDAYGADESAGNAVSIRLKADPPAWDSLAAAYGSLFICTEDGRVTCFKSGE